MKQEKYENNYFKNYLTLFLAFVVLGFFVPKWALYLMTVSLNYGIIVLGMLLLARTGLVSFGHGLYYCLGAYAAGTLKPLFGINEISIMLFVINFYSFHNIDTAWFSIKEISRYFLRNALFSFFHDPLWFVS